MTINTKYNIGDIIYFLYENKVINDEIDAIFYSLYKDNSGGLKYRLKNFYKGNHLEFKENEIFSTKEELIK